MSKVERRELKRALGEAVNKIDTYQRVKNALTQLRQVYRRHRNALPPPRYFEVRDMIRDVRSQLSQQPQLGGRMQEFQQNSAAIKVAAYVDGISRKDFQNEKRKYDRAIETMECALHGLEDLCERYRESNSGPFFNWYRDRKAMIKRLLRDDRLTDHDLVRDFRVLESLRRV